MHFLFFLFFYFSVAYSCPAHVGVDCEIFLLLRGLHTITKKEEEEEHRDVRLSSNSFMFLAIELTYPRWMDVYNNYVPKLDNLQCFEYILFLYITSQNVCLFIEPVSL